MADNYIDQHETKSYGDFTVAQILALVVGLVPPCDGALHHVASNLKDATEGMREVLDRVGDVEKVTYKQPAGAHDPAAHAGDVLGRAAKYAASRPDGKALAKKVLNDATISTVKRFRPTRLVGALDHALGVFEKEADRLPEHAQWARELKEARDDLHALDQRVRASRINRREMVPEVVEARQAWLHAYGAAKCVVEGVLKLALKTELMTDVFDDLADVHRAPNVHDDDPDGERPTNRPVENPPR